MGIIDSIYIDMLMGVGERFLEEGIMLLDVSSVGQVNIFYWSQDSRIVRVCLAQLMVGFVIWSQCYNSPLFFSFLFRLTFLSSAITHPSHVIGPLTTLVFIIASFHPVLWTSMTQSTLLICTSSRFHHIPPYSICSFFVLELSKSQVYKPSTCYELP